MAAQASSTDSYAPQNLCLIPDSDLAELNPGTEYACQILNQLPEIDPPVCSKIKQHLIVVKRIFCLNQLHLQAVLPNLFLADTEGFLLLLPVGRLPRVILRRRNPDHRL